MSALSESALARLRTRHPVLAEVVDSDRAIAAMRQSGVVDLAAVRVRRERVRAAAASWGHALRGDGDRHA